MTNDHAANSETIWSWQPELTDELRRKVTMATAVAAAVVVATGAVAVVSPARFTIVLTVLMAGIGVFWWLEHRRFRSTIVQISADSTLHVHDGRTSSSIDLAIVDSVDVRQRVQSGQGLSASTPKWTIELAGPNHTLVHPIAHAGGLFNPDTADIERLRADLIAHVEQSAQRHVGATDANPSTSATPEPAPTSDSIGAVMGGQALVGASDQRFEWKPPVSANADRRRRWFRIAYIGAALIVAGLGAAAAWGDWVGVALSAVTVPGLILACCGGLDYALTRNRRFRLAVADGVLSVERSGPPKQITLRGASVKLDRTSSHVATGSGTMRSTNWTLTVEASDGSVLRQVMPSFGTVTVADDYVALERELNRRT